MKHKKHDHKHHHKDNDKHHSGTDFVAILKEREALREQLDEKIKEFERFRVQSNSKQYDLMKRIEELESEKEVSVLFVILLVFFSTLNLDFKILSSTPDWDHTYYILF